MPNYTYPDMPLLMRVWYTVEEPPPTGPPDASAVPCSLSPMTPADFFGFYQTSQAWPPGTHIIRTPIDRQFSDNMLIQAIGRIWPCSMFEIPSESGHMYVCGWSHEVGAGFPNHHQRVFCWRWVASNPGNPPYFRGWI